MPTIDLLIMPIKGDNCDCVVMISDLKGEQIVVYNSQVYHRNSQKRRRTLNWLEKRISKNVVAVTEGP